MFPSRCNFECEKINFSCELQSSKGTVRKSSRQRLLVTLMSHQHQSNKFKFMNTVIWNKTSKCRLTAYINVNKQYQAINHQIYTIYIINKQATISQNFEFLDPYPPWVRP